MERSVELELRENIKEVNEKVTSLQVSLNEKMTDIKVSLEGLKTKHRRVDF